MKFFIRLKLVLSSLLIIVFSSGCFEVIEEVNLNNGGDGSFTFTVNMSKSKIQLSSIMLLDSINGYPVPKVSDIQKELNALKSILVNTPGLVNVEVNSDYNNYVFIVKGVFNSVNVLNEALARINQSVNYGRNIPRIDDNFSFTGNIFKRILDYDFENDFITMKAQDKLIFDNANYISIYRFEKEIDSFTNDIAIKSKNGKAIMLKTSIKDIIHKKTSIQNEINLN